MPVPVNKKGLGGLVKEAKEFSEETVPGLLMNSKERIKARSSTLDGEVKEFMEKVEVLTKTYSFEGVLKDANEGFLKVVAKDVATFQDWIDGHIKLCAKNKTALLTKKELESYKDSIKKAMKTNQKVMVRVYKNTLIAYLDKPVAYDNIKKGRFNSNGLSGGLLEDYEGIKSRMGSRIKVKGVTKNKITNLKKKLIAAEAKKYEEKFDGFISKVEEKLGRVKSVDGLKTFLTWCMEQFKSMLGLSSKVESEDRPKIPSPQF